MKGIGKMQQNFKTVRVYSCLAESPEETPHVLVEACLADGRVISGEMSAMDAAGLAESLQRAARTVGAAMPSHQKRICRSFSEAQFAVKP